MAVEFDMKNKEVRLNGKCVGGLDYGGGRIAVIIAALMSGCTRLRIFHLARWRIQKRERRERLASCHLLKFTKAGSLAEMLRTKLFQKSLALQWRNAISDGLIRACASVLQSQLGR